MWLLHFGTESGGVRIKITNPEYVIGSGVGGFLRLRDPISPDFELCLRPSDDCVSIRCKNNNGSIMLNGRPIIGTVEAREGDSLQFAGAKATIVRAEPLRESMRTKAAPRASAKANRELFLEISAGDGGFAPIVKKISSGKDWILIGSSDECDVSLPSLAVSRLHAKAGFDEFGAAWVKDMDSTNGLFLNGKRIREAEIMDGDVVAAGDYLIKARLGGSDETEEAPEAEDTAVVGRSAATTKTRRLIRKFAPSAAPAIIVGESGCGKELIAKALHELSGRRGAFVALNAAAIPEKLFESQLFGHVKGAFTGADRDAKGAMLEAEEGTLFLDEIGDVAYELQAKLLRAIENKEAVPVGGVKAVKSTCRFVFATNKNLSKMVEEGKFREDLFFRVCVLKIAAPPLRDRLEDLPQLARFFLDELDCPLSLSAEALEALRRRRWSGNVRELKNVITRAAITASGETGKTTIEAADWEFDDETRADDKSKPEENVSAPETIRGSERETIIRALRDCGGNKAAAAKRLGVMRSTLYLKLDKYKITEYDYSKK